MGLPASPTLRCSARCTTSCSPAPRCATSSTTCAPAPPSPPRAANDPGPFLWPLRPWVTHLHAPFITNFTGFGEPRRLLAELVPDLTVRELAFGAGYIATGHVPATENPDNP